MFLGHRIRCFRPLFRASHEEGYILKKSYCKLKEPKLGKRIPKFHSELTFKGSLPNNDGKCAI